MVKNYHYIPNLFDDGRGDNQATYARNFFFLQMVIVPYQSVAHVIWIQTHALRASWHSNNQSNRADPPDGSLDRRTLPSLVADFVKVGSVFTLRRSPT